MTNAQLVTIVVGVVGFFLAVGFLKKTAKIIVGLAILLIAGMLYFGLEPKQVFDTAMIVKERGTAIVKSLSSASSSIKMDGDKILIKVNDTWIDVSAITSVPSFSGDSYATFKVDSEVYEVYDGEIIKLLKTLLTY